jgi:hypothetical protein
MIVFVDTNYFLQCKSYKELDWKEVFKGEELLVIIPITVLTEIDDKKKGGKSRIVKKGREATTFIKNIIRTDDSVFTDKIEGIQISFRVAERYSDDCLGSLSNSLNLSIADHRIIAEILCYLNNTESEKIVSLLTHDTNLIALAKTYKIDTILIPDSWLLPPENDAKDKEIINLQKEIIDLKKTHPDIDVVFSVNGETTQNTSSIAKFDLKIIQYVELSTYEMDYLIDIVKNNHPKQPVSTNKINIPGLWQNSMTYIPPTSEEISKYDQDYDQWLEDTKSNFDQIIKNDNSYNCLIDIVVNLKSTGFVPVEKLICNVTATIGGVILPGDFEFKKSERKLPSPPKPPQGSVENLYSSLIKSNFDITSYLPIHDHITTLNNLMPKQPFRKDRYEFYHHVQNETTIQFECEEFRHQTIRDLKVKTFAIKDTDQLVIDVEISGYNLREPVKRTLLINIGRQQVNMFDSLKTLVE